MKEFSLPVPKFLLPLCWSDAFGVFVTSLEGVLQVENPDKARGLEHLVTCIGNALVIRNSTNSSQNKYGIYFYCIIKSLDLSNCSLI